MARETRSRSARNRRLCQESHSAEETPARFECPPGAALWLRPQWRRQPARSALRIGPLPPCQANVDQGRAQQSDEVANAHGARVVDRARAVVDVW
jgi:hypothetical protein